MKNNYNFAVTELLKSEGGYTNDPSDSGGATNFGITIGDYRRYINKAGTANDVKNMTVGQAKNIYKTKYWDALGGDTLPSGVDYTCFDYGVLSGLGRPRAALGKFKDLTGDKLIDAINDERTGFLTRLATNRPKDKKFLRGWLTRTERVRKQSHTLAKGNTTAGPATGTTAAIGLWATLSQYVHNHPYIVASASIAIGLAIWAAVHYYRNKQ
jgi:lysozyme family protein